MKKKNFKIKYYNDALILIPYEDPDKIHLTNKEHREINMWVSKIMAQYRVNKKTMRQACQRYKKVEIKIWK